VLDLGTLVGYLDLDDQKFEGVLDKLPEKVRGSGAAMGIAGGLVAAGVGAVIGKGIALGLDLDDAQHKITAELGLTAEESGRIGAIAGKLYADNYGESIEDVNNSVASVVSGIEGMRGATEGALEKMTAKAINFSSAFEIDVGRSTQVVGQLLKTGLVKDANEGFDLLTVAMQKVPKAVREDVLDALDEYGPFFQQLGFSGEQAFAALVSGAEKGMYGIDKTGDALKEFTIRATDMSTTSVAAYEALGLNAEEMAKKVLAGGDSASEATYQIAQGLLDVEDPAKRANLAIALFGTPLEDLGTGQIPKFLDSLLHANDALGTTAGAADKMGETLNGSASKGWETLSRTFESITGKIGGALVPILGVVADWLNDNPVALQAVAIAVGILAVAFIALSVAMWAASLTPVGLMIGAIVLAIGIFIGALILLISHWDEVIAFLSGALREFLGFVGEVWTNITTFFTEAIDNIVAWVTDNWGLLLSLLIGPIGLAIQWVVEHWGEILQGIQTGFEAVVAWLQAIPGVILGFFAGIGTWLLQTGTDLLVGLGTGIINGWAAVVAFFQAVPTTVLNLLAAAGTWLISTGGNLITGFRTGVTNMWTGFMDFLRGIPGAIGGFFGGIGSWLYNSGRDLIQGLLNGVRSLAGTIGSFFLGLLPSWIVGPFKAALGIRSPSTVFAGYGRNIAQGIVVGLDQEQAALDARMRDLVGVPSATDAEMARQAASGAYSASQGTERAGARSYLVVNGDLGYSMAEVQAASDFNLARAASLSGLDEDVPVA